MRVLGLHTKCDWWILSPPDERCKQKTESNLNITSMYYTARQADGRIYWYSVFIWSSCLVRGDAFLCGEIMKRHQLTDGDAMMDRLLPGQLMAPEQIAVMASAPPPTIRLRSRAQGLPVQCVNKSEAFLEFFINVHLLLFICLHREFRNDSAI